MGTLRAMRHSLGSLGRAGTADELGWSLGGTDRKQAGRPPAAACCLAAGALISASMSGLEG